MRGGRRVTTEHAIIYFSARAGAEPARFGFVVSKAVGGAVKRNRLRRRLRAIAFEHVQAGVVGSDIVVRALSGSAELPWASLQREITTAIEKGTRP